MNADFRNRDWCKWGIEYRTRNTCCDAYKLQFNKEPGKKLAQTQTENSIIHEPCFNPTPTLAISNPTRSFTHYHFLWERGPHTSCDHDEFSPQKDQRSSYSQNIHIRHVPFLLSVILLQKNHGPRLISWLDRREDQRTVFSSSTYETPLMQTSKAPELLTGVPSVSGISTLNDMFATDDSYSLLGLENDFDFSFEFQQMTPMPLWYFF